MGGREPRLLEHLHDLIRDLSLFWRKDRRLVPVQASANICVDSGTRVCELVSELVQLAHLLEQRLELHVVDGHDRGQGTSPGRKTPALRGTEAGRRFAETREARLARLHSLLSHVGGFHSLRRPGPVVLGEGFTTKGERMEASGAVEAAFG